MSVMTAMPLASAASDQLVDTLGYAYDTTWLDDAFGTRHYRRQRALGRAGGPATWSDLYYENPICGHHLSGKCTGCHTCLNCGGRCRCGRR